MRKITLLPLLILLLPVTRAQEPPIAAEAEDPAWKALQAAAESFVKAYNAKDSEALAALVTPDGEMLQSDGGRIAGREAIQAYYDAIFEERPDAQISLEATSVRFLAPKLAVEDGALYLTEGQDGEPAAFLYTALHTQQDDGSWLMAQTQAREVENLAAHEALAAVDGLVGDWIGRTPAGSLKISFRWDESGSFLLGTGVYSAAGLEPASESVRIGWDSVRKRITSWMFDSQGGYSKGEWTDTEDRWIIKADGYTSAGELTSSTQILQPTGEDAFTWTVTDKIIGGEVLEEQTLRMVRQPPEPNFPAE